MNRSLLSIASSLTISILVVTTGTMAATHRSNTDILLTRKLNCDRPQTQREMNECAAIAYQAADQKLNQVYQELKAALPKKTGIKPRPSRTAFDYILSGLPMP